MKVRKPLSGIRGKLAFRCYAASSFGLSEGSALHWRAPHLEPTHAVEVWNTRVQSGTGCARKQSDVCVCLFACLRTKVKRWACMRVCVFAHGSETMGVYACLRVCARKRNDGRACVYFLPRACVDFPMPGLQEACSRPPGNFQRCSTCLASASISQN